MAFNKNNSDEKLITTSRIKYIVIAGILLLAAIALVSLAIWTSQDAEKPEKEIDTTNLYSAARYFCRMKHPDNWEISADENGFYMNEDTGLIFQAYPFTTKPVDVVLEEGATMPPTTPEPQKIPVEGVLVSVFYQANPDFAWPVEETLPPEVTPSPTPTVTAVPTPTFAPYDLSKAGKSAVEIMKTKVLPGDSIEGGPDFSMKEGNPYNGKNCKYLTYSYQYTNAEGDLIKGDMYVCSRAMSYYMITYEAKADIYDTYRPHFMSMVNNFTLSIFDY